MSDRNDSLGFERVVLDLGVRRVIGQFWLVHHRLFQGLKGYDAGLLWFNLVTLLTVCFLPFPTAVLGDESGQDDAAGVFYALSMSVSSLCFTLMWVYASARGLTREARGSPDNRRHVERSILTTCVFFISVPIAAYQFSAAVACWVVLLPALRIALLHWQRRREDALSHGG